MDISKFLQIRAELDDLRIECDELKTKLSYARLYIEHLEHLAKELQNQRNKIMTSAKDVSSKLATATRRLQQSKPKKSVSDLIDPVYRQQRLTKLQSKLGPKYKIVEASPAINDFCHFIRVHRLTKRTVDALSKLLPLDFPTLRYIRRTEQDIFNNCGGLTSIEEDRISMIWARNTSKIFDEYYNHLLQTAWSSCRPERIQLIFSDDRD